MEIIDPKVLEKELNTILKNNLEDDCDSIAKKFFETKYSRIVESDYTNNYTTTQLDSRVYTCFDENDHIVCEYRVYLWGRSRRCEVILVARFKEDK